MQTMPVDYIPEFEDEEAIQTTPQVRTMPVDYVPEFEDEGGTGTAFMGGVKQTGTALKSAFNVVTDDEADVRAATQMSDAIPTTMAQDAFRQEIARLQQANDGSIWQGIKNVMGAAVENPRGAWHEITAQLPNSGVVMGSMAAGAKIGSAAGPIGTVAGGLVGLLFGNVAIETGFMAQEDVREGDYDRDEAIEKGIKMGGTISAIDTATMGASYAMFRPVYKASQNAITRTVAAVGVNPSDKVAVAKAFNEIPGLIQEARKAGAKAAVEAAPKGVKSAGIHGTALGLEVAGEGTGEYLGSVAAGVDASFTEAALESLMSVPQSAGTVAAGKMLAKSKDATQNLLDKRKDFDPGIPDETPATPETADPWESEFDAEWNRRAEQKKQQAMGRPAPDQTDIRIQTMRKEHDQQMERMEAPPDYDLKGSVNLLESNVEKFRRLKSQEESAQALQQRQQAMGQPGLYQPPTAQTALQGFESRQERHLPSDANVPVIEAAPEAKPEPTGYYPFADLGGRLGGREKLLGPEPETPSPILPGTAFRGRPVFENEVDPEQVNTEPTEAQKKAGNYKKEHVKIDGLDISIENPAGTTRKGRDRTGKQWEAEMQSHYGYFRRSEGKDGDQVDVFIKPDTETSPKVFVVDQVDPDTGKFDEHKAVMGAETEQEARGIYLSNYEDGWKGLGAVTEMDQAGFKEWLKDGTRTKKPVAEKTTEADAQTPQEKLDAIDKFFAGDNKKGLEKKLSELKQNRNQFKDDPEFLKQVDEQIAEIEKTLAPAATETTETHAGLEPGTPVTWKTKKGETLTGTLSRKVKTNWFVEKSDGKKTLVPESQLSVPDTEKPTMSKREQTVDDGSIGTNPSGRKVFVDEKGVRSYQDGNVRSKQPVSLAPTRAGVKMESDNAHILYNRGRTDYLTTEEIAEFEKAAKQETPQPAEGEKDIPEDWKKVPGGGVVSEFGDSKYLISGKPGEYQLSDRVTGNVIGGVFTNIETAANRGNQHWVESQRGAKPEREFTPPPKKQEYGADNKLFTQDAAEKARALIRSKLNQLSSGVDPELMQAGITMAGYHIEAGARSFAAYSKAMVNDFGEAIKPFLRSFYEGARYYPGLETDGMTDPKNIDESVEIADNETTTPTKEAANDNADNTDKRGEGTAADDSASPGSQSAQDAPVSEKERPAEVVREPGGKKADGGLRDGGKRSPDKVKDKPASKRDDDRGSEETGDGPVRSLESDDSKPPGVQRRDHRITPGDIDRQGGWPQAAKANLDAIELYKKITEENRPATPSEQKILAKYVGWGATELANNMFPGYSKKYDSQVNPEYSRSDTWKPLVQRLVKALTPEEIAAAASSTKNAHYTSTEVITSIYGALDRMGFKGGKILEPGMGVGNFVGLLPDNMRKATTYTGVEMDHVSAGIANLLYPNQNVIQGDFSKRKFPKNFFDAAIGNPPFGSIPILADPEYKKYGFAIHNYFFAKSVDRVRPGGVLVFVTSRYTMDAKKDRARQYLADRADLLGAIRLPQTAFKKNAGTEVVTDVLFFQKREEGADPAGQSWTGTKEVPAKDKDDDAQMVPINEYFAEHPEMVLGQHSLAGSMYAAKEYTVTPIDGKIEDLFEKAAQNLPEKIYSPVSKKNKTATDTATLIERDFNPANKKEKGIYLGPKGVLMRVEFGSGVPLKSRVKLTKAQESFMKDFVGLRDKTKLSMQAQLQDGDWESAQKDLNKSYDAFVKKHGNIHAHKMTVRTVTNADGVKEKIEAPRYENWKIVNEDAEGPLVWALEKIENDGTIAKAPALKGRTLSPPSVPDIKSVPDAVAVSLSERGSLDLDNIAELSERPVKEVVEIMGDMLYLNPETGQHVMADEYLSGDVVQKLEEAQEAAKADKEFARNVEALKKAQPEPLSSEQIYVTMGANWIANKYYSQFATDVLGFSRAKISYDYRLGKWDIEVPGRPQGYRSNTDDWSTDFRGKNEILDAILNNRTIRVTQKVDKKTVLNEAATVAANEVAKNMRERFGEWVWEESDRANDLLTVYNRTQNNLAGRRFDGSHLQLPGVSLLFDLHPHQKDVIWRVIQTGNTYINHAVGGGKTFEMIAAGMEMKRLGLVKKPVYAVPIHMLGQFSQEFQMLYPAADIMVADSEAFHATKRRQFVAQATMNNPDAIIITHSALERIKSKEENIAPIRDEFIQGMLFALEDLEAEGASHMKIKQAEAMIEKAEQRFDSLIAEGDDVVTFEDMGIDFMFVDEAHEFRKLDYSTSRQIKGIDPTGSKKALNLYIKTVYLDSVNKGRSHVFASGTPVVNTVGEMFSILRFFDKAMLEKDGLEYFDAWANLYGQAVSDYELNSAGRFEIVERFSRFVNVPEMMSRVRQFTDVLTSEQLGTRVKRPAIKGGDPEVILAPKNAALQDYMTNVLAPRIEQSRKWKPSKEEKGNPDPMVRIITDGRLASIDMRFVNPRAPSDPTSKLNIFIDGIIKSYKEQKDREYMTPDGKAKSPHKGAAQIVFFNLGFGKGVTETRGFDARAWLMTRLKEAGIPAQQVGWIADANTSVKKQALFKEVREGTKRILIGSATQMGTGVNAQTRLADLHYLDAPWFPALVEQPEGRILRQGNQNKEVGIYRYATEGSYDATMWQMVARKARMINQAWSGDKSVRTIEDLSEVSQYAMAAAMASGDTRMVELVQLEADVSRLERLFVAHQRKQESLDREIREMSAEIKSNEKQLDSLKAAQKKYPEYMSRLEGAVGKKKFDNRDEFNQALAAAANKAAVLPDGNVDENLEKTEIGSVYGAKIFIDKIAYLQEPSANIYMSVADGVKTTFNAHPLRRRLDSPEHDIAAFLDTTDFATRALNYLNKIPSAVSSVERAIKDQEQELARTKKLVDAPFAQMRELTEKRGRRQVLEAELVAEGQDVEAEPENLASQALEDAAEGTQQRSVTTPAKPKYLTKDGYGNVAEVDGKPVTLEGYEGVEFFRHKKEGRWYIVEKTTGLSAGNGETIAEAEGQALDRISQNYPTQEQFQEFLDGLEKLDDAKYSTTTDYTPGQGLTLKDIQSRFKGQHVFLSPDGSIAIRMKNGMGLTIRQVRDFGNGDIRVAMQTGRMDKSGVILGKYESKEIALNRDLSDTITLDHELYHFLAENLLTKGDRLAIKAKARAYHQAGNFRFKWRPQMEENEANAFAQFLQEREQHRDTPLGRAIQKVVDFFDGLTHIGRASTRKLARGVESGKVYGRQSAAGQGAGQQFMFAGPEAQGADKSLAFEAQQMRDSGASREEVWNKTGWWEIVPGSDVWSFEIDDSEISWIRKFDDPPLGRTQFKTVGEFIRAPELFRAYPWLKDVLTAVRIDPDIEHTGGKYVPAMSREAEGQFDIEQEIRVNAKSTDEAKSTILHEIQHAIQDHEGFATGGNAQEFVDPRDLRELAELEKNQDPQYQERLDAISRDAHGQYQVLTGEAQARIAQKRRDMSPAQRKAEPPWETLEKMLRDEGLLFWGNKPEDVLDTRYDSVPSYHVDPDYKPKKTVKAYKLMQFKKTQPGKLFPLFIGKDKSAVFDQWNIAEFLPTKGFADRPGWHAGHLPIAPHLRQKSTGKKAPNRVWVEVLMPADKDWQKVADATKTKDIRDRIPKDGYYKFKTSKMQGGAWLIGGAAKFNRVLNDAEVSQILKDAGYPDAEIQAEMHGKDPQYSTSSDRIIPEKFAQDPTTKEKVSDLFNKTKSKEERSLAMDRFLSKTLDSLHFIGKRLDEETYKMHRMLTGINSSTFGTWLKHGQLFVNGNTFGVKGQKQGPMAFFETLGKTDAENLVYWVSAKRAEQLEADGRENWLDLDARDAIFERVGTHASDGRTWASLNMTLQKFNKNILDVAQEAGLIDPEARAEWESNFYIPFNRIMEDPQTYEAFLAGPRKNRQHISAQIRRLKGGEGKIDPMGNLFRNWMFLLDASARNMARENAFDVGSQIGIIEEVSRKELINIIGSKSVTRYAARKAGADRAAKVFDTKEQAEAWIEGKPGYQIEQRKYNSVTFGRMRDFGILSFQRNGEPVYFKTLDQDLFEALSEIDTTAFNNIFMKMMGGSKRWLSYGVTFGPAFRLRNMLRDTVHVAIVSKSFKPFLDSATGFVKAIKEDVDFKEYSATGFAFGSSYIHTDDPGHASKMIKKLIKQEGDGVVDNILHTPKKLLSVWEKIGEASENAARLGLYTNLRKKGATPFEAGFQARDLMDFSMRGGSQTVQILTRIIPFLNARGQGLYKLGRSAHENPKAFTLKAAMYTTAALALWSLFKDDDRYKELQDFDKWTYHHFWFGDDHYRIPKPFEIGALFASLPESVANVMNDTEDGKFVWDWFTFTVHDVFNVGYPQLFKPVIEERFNMSTFRGQRIVPDYMTKLKPSEQYKEYTSESMRAIGKQLNISPIKLEHYVTGYFSTLGMMVLTPADAIVRAAGGYPARPAGGPNPFLLGVVNKKYSSNKYVNRFYDFYGEVDSAYRTLRHLAKTGQVEDAKAFARDNADLLSGSLKKTTNKIRGYLSDVNQKIKLVQRDKTMTPKEKREIIDMLNDRKKQVTKALFEKIRAK